MPLRRGRRRWSGRLRRRCAGKPGWSASAHARGVGPTSLRPSLAELLRRDDVGGPRSSGGLGLGRNAVLLRAFACADNLRGGGGAV